MNAGIRGTFKAHFFLNCIPSTIEYMPDNIDRSLLYRIPKKSGSLERGDNHLFVVGINAYKQLGKLGNAVRDAQAFRDLLLDRYRFEKEHIYELYDEQATRQNIMGGLRDLIEKIKPKDSLIIYFSGHGHYDPVFKEGYWVPVGANYDVVDDYIPYNFLQQVARAVPARHLLMIVDSCYSGAVLVRERDIVKERLERDPSRWIIASGRNEVVPDSDLMEEKHSPFAKQLLDLLRDYSQDGLTTLGLVDRLTENVSYNSKQTPIGQALHGVGHKGGQFIFYPRKNEARDWSETQQKNTTEAYQQFSKNYPKSIHLDQAVWQNAGLKNDKTAYRTYLSTQANGKYRLQANEQIFKIEDWERFEKARNQGEGALGMFIEKYPNSAHWEAAHAEVKRIRTGEPVGKQKPTIKSPPAGKTPPRKKTPISTKVDDEPKHVSSSIPFLKRPAVKYALIGLPILILLIWAVPKMINRTNNASSNSKYAQLIQKADKTFLKGRRNRDAETVKLALSDYMMVLQSLKKSPAALRGQQASRAWLTAYTDSVKNLSSTRSRPDNTIEELKAKGVEIISPWSDGVAIYKKGRAMGLISKQGKVLSRSYETVSGLQYGYAVFKANSKYGYLKQDGKEIISAKFDAAGPFDHTGQAKVKEGNKIFYINPQGKCVKDCVDPIVERRKLEQAQRLQKIEEDKRRKALAEQKKTDTNSRRQIKVTLIRLVCELSDDEGPGNDADMDRFKFTLHANQKSCSNGKDKTLTGNGMIIYEYSGAAITTPKGYTWRDQNKSTTITYDHEHCKSLNMRLEGYAREQDNGSSSEDEEINYTFTIPNSDNRYGNHTFRLRTSDFVYRCEFKIEKVGSW